MGVFLARFPLEPDCSSGWRRPLRLSRLNVNATLKDGGRGGRLEDGARGPCRGFWSSAEIALAVVLLAGAGVMMRSFLNVSAADVGDEDVERTVTLWRCPVGLRLPSLRSLSSNRSRRASLACLAWTRWPSARSLPAERERREASKCPRLPGRRRRVRDKAGRKLTRSSQPRRSGLRCRRAPPRPRFQRASDNTSSGVPVVVVNERFASTHLAWRRRSRETSACLRRESNRVRGSRSSGWSRTSCKTKHETGVRAADLLAISASHGQ